MGVNTMFFGGSNKITRLKTLKKKEDQVALSIW